MYEDTALHISRMKKKEDIAMQTGNLLEETTPNYRFMNWIWNHHWRNHYSYVVIRVTRSSTNLHLYYFIVKSNLFIKILQRSKNTKSMKFVQNYKFLKIFRCFQQNSHCQNSKSCRTLKISQNMSNRYKLKVTKTQPTPVYTFWNFSKSLSEGIVLPPPPPTHPSPTHFPISSSTESVFLFSKKLTFLIDLV